VNGDGSIEYSEIAAFFAAANLRVSDPRARLSVIAEPPRLDRSAPLLRLPKLNGHFSVSGRADGPWARPFFVENERGERVLDAFVERGMRLTVRLPANQRLFIVRPDGRR
jgi:hypothetical protein